MLSYFISFFIYSYVHKRTQSSCTIYNKHVHIIVEPQKHNSGNNEPETLFYLNPPLHIPPILLAMPQVSLCGICIMRTLWTCTPYIFLNCTVIDRYANKRFSVRWIASQSLSRLRVQSLLNVLAMLHSNTLPFNISLRRPRRKYS